MPEKPKESPVDAKRVLQVLDWDSHFFGFRVGRCNEPDLPQDALGEGLQQARSEGCRVVYWPASNRKENEVAAAALGGKLMDQRRTYVRSLEGLSAADLVVNWFIESYRRSLPDAELEELALQAGEYSRFRRDPGFGQESFERLYRAWIRNSVSRSIAEEVLFIEDFGLKRALLTLGLQNGRPDIGLLATQTEYRGRGMAADLVRASLIWAINRDYQEAQVCTQAENAGACAFYEAMGYAVEREEWIYHFWL